MSNHTPEPAILPAATADQPVWIRVGWLFDGETIHRDVHLVYNTRSVLHLAADSPCPEVAGRTDPHRNLPDSFVVPGLIEGHSHVFLQGEELDLETRKAYQQQDPATLLEKARVRMRDLVWRGIVATRDGGDKDGVGLALARETRSGSKATPATEVYSPGAGIHREKRYGSFFARPLEEFPDFDQCVVNRVTEGADHVKIVPTGIINFQKGSVTARPQLNTEEVAALVASSHTRGKQVMAHASGEDGIGHAIDGGVDTLEHGFFISREQLLRMRDRRTVWVPTFAPVRRQVIHAAAMGWDNEVVGHLKRILEQHAASLQQALALGVRIGVGSDAGSVGVGHGDGFFDELEWMEEAGMPSLSLLRAATTGNATMLGSDTGLGSLRPNGRPSFLLLRKNPAKHLGTLREPRAVIINGYPGVTAESEDR